MKTRIRLLLGPALVVAMVSAVLFGGAQSASPSPVKNKVLRHQLNVELGKEKPTFPKEQHVSSGVMYTLLEATGALQQREKGLKPPAQIPAGAEANSNGCQKTFTGTGKTNVRINQDCSLRRQAEEVVAVNPTDPNNIVGGQNDSSIGFNHCGYDYSLDGGIHWGSLLPPFFTFQFDPTDPVGDTADACSDPTATFDSKGNAYVGGILFNIDQLSSAIIVARSDHVLKGSFYHGTDTSDPFHKYDVPRCIVGVACHGVVDTEPNNENVFDDKELMVADATPSSPKHDYVYVTWTRFAVTGFGVGVDSPIYFSQSTDGGDTWSPGIEISGSNTTYCTDFSGESDPNACDQDQGSHPIVGPDGTIYVSFGNGNTPTFGVNQHMMVKCPATADCTIKTNWQGPYFVTDDIGTQPVENGATNAVTGCPSGRQCLPPNGYRLDDFVHGSISVDNGGNLYFAWDDFRNGVQTPGCNTLDYDTAVPPCNNDVFFTYSTSGGTSWAAPILVTPSSTFGLTAQWMPWSSIGPNGKVLSIGYYDRSFGTCETDGCNDIVLAKVTDPLSGSRTFDYRRITTSSMPNLVIANNPIQAGFLGDYMWVATDNGGGVHITWADTRGRGIPGVVEEDVYYSE